MTEATIKTYTTRGYAIRAARAALKAAYSDPMSGVHFRIEPAGDEFVWHEINPKTGEIAASERVEDGVQEPAPKAEALPVVTIPNDTRSPKRKAADAAAQAEGYPNATRAAEAKAAQVRAAHAANPNKDGSPKSSGPKAPKAPREGGVVANKVGQLAAQVQTAEGLTETQLKTITGWTKFGGFYAAVKQAGLVMTREKVDGENVWHASAPQAAAA